MVKKIDYLIETLRYLRDNTEEVYYNEIQNCIDIVEEIINREAPIYRDINGKIIKANDTISFYSFAPDKKLDIRKVYFDTKHNDLWAGEIPLNLLTNERSREIRILKDCFIIKAESFTTHDIRWFIFKSRQEWLEKFNTKYPAWAFYTPGKEL